VEAYRALVGRLLADGWSLGSFGDDASAAARTIYLRHDVDYSLELAVELAELNNGLGIAGTFFVQVRGQLYNVFEEHETARVRRLRSLGQCVALHYVGDNAAEVLEDFELLLRVEPNLDRAFSWHNPTEAFFAGPEVDVPGLVNVYGDRFFRAMPYLSDSVHRVSVAELESALASETSSELQLLLHPVNWIAGGSSGIEILIRGWTRVLRDHERTLRQNRSFSPRFPDGLPPQLVAEFERELLAAAAAV
jgi:hypothetical protein